MRQIINLKDLGFKINYTVPYRKNNESPGVTIYEVLDEYLQLWSWGFTIEELKRTLERDVRFLIDEIAYEDDTELTPKAKEVKYRILELLENFDK